MKQRETVMVGGQLRPEDTLTEFELYALRRGVSGSHSQVYLASGGMAATQADFARWLGVAPNTYALYERGELAISVPMARLVVYVVAEWSKTSPKKIRLLLEERRKQAARHTTRKAKK